MSAKRRLCFFCESSRVSLRYTVVGCTDRSIRAAFSPDAPRLKPSDRFCGTERIALSLSFLATFASAFLLPHSRASGGATHLTYSTRAYWHVYIYTLSFTPSHYERERVNALPHQAAPCPGATCRDVVAPSNELRSHLLKLRRQPIPSGNTLLFKPIPRHVFFSFLPLLETSFAGLKLLICIKSSSHF